MDEESRWPAAWVRASLDLAILGCLASQDMHGYAIASHLAGHGMGRLKGGSLYPVLARLEQAGLVEAVWQAGESGPGRKAYSLTPAGREERALLLAAWRDLTDTLTALAEAPSSSPAHPGASTPADTREVVR